MRSARRRRHLRNEEQELNANLLTFREGISEIVSHHIRKYEAIIGVSDLGLQFEQDVIDAFQWCILTIGVPLKRQSKIRKELLHLGKELRTAEVSLHRLRSALENFSPRFSELVEPLLDTTAKIALAIIAKQPPWFYALSSVAHVVELRASALKGTDKGGAPGKPAFRILIQYLARAFKNATKREAKVTWNEVACRYEGDFVRLVEAVLPLIQRIAKQMGQPLPCPDSRRSRGQYIYGITRAGAGKRKRST